MDDAFDVHAGHAELAKHAELVAVDWMIDSVNSAAGVGVDVGSPLDVLDRVILRKSDNSLDTL